MSSTIYNKLLKVAGIAAVAAGGIALANELMTKHALSSDTPVIQEHYYEWRYGKIFYTRQGQGSPILFIHGLYPGAGSHTMQILADALSDQHTVYLIDLPGFGLSDKPHLTYTAFFYVQMLNEFIENVIQTPTCVFADSLSCAFTSIACQVQPKLYSRLILLNPPTHEEEMKIPTRMNRFVREILELPLVGTFIYNLATTKYQLHAQYGQSLNEAEIQLCSARAHHKISGAKYSYASLKNNYMNANISRPLSKMDTSIYVIVSGDMEIAKNQIEYLYSLNSSIEAEYIKGNKNFLWMQDPTDILEICHILL